jgi:hypothetical protein
MTGGRRGARNVFADKGSEPLSIVDRAVREVGHRACEQGEARGYQGQVQVSFDEALVRHTIVCASL